MENVESEEPFFCLLLCVTGMAADLSDFDRGQIVMEQPFSKMHDSWDVRDLQLLVFIQSG